MKLVAHFFNKNIFFIFILLLLISCENISGDEDNTEEPKYKIDSESYSSKYKGNRIRYIILHYTYLNDEDSIKTLTEDRVSSHYLITTEINNPIYRLVDENERAWHAGLSSFDGHSAINDSSIGIEIVHQGIYDTEEYEQAKGISLSREQKHFPEADMYMEYDKEQLDKLVFLLKDIIKRYDIHPRNITGHADVAPTRKQDPGPKFPWKWLYDEHHIGFWYDEDEYQALMISNDYGTAKPMDIKKEFHKYGYTSMPTNNDKWDIPSRKVIYAFQCHYRQGNIDGNMDMETYVVLKALNNKLQSERKRQRQKEATVEELIRLRAIRESNLEEQQE